LPGRAGTALVAAADPPATARPHGSGPSRRTSPARSDEPLAGTNLDPSRRLGRQPHRPWIGLGARFGTVLGPHVVRDGERSARLCTSCTAASRPHIRGDQRKRVAAIYWRLSVSSCWGF
jgi:hypothetical protein